MRLKGHCQQKKLRVLIDTGSTHNFLSAKMVHKLKCNLVPAKAVSVEVANGQTLSCEFICKRFEWDMQGNDYVA